MNRARNSGIRKRCGCPRKHWPKCPHPWHFNFKWRGRHYRLSLDRRLGKPLRTKADALAEADRLRTEIRDGNLNPSAPVDLEASRGSSSVLTFAQFAEIWKERRGVQLVRPRDNAYRIKKICGFKPTTASVAFGDKPLNAITTDDIECFRDARRSGNLSPVTINHDLKLLRKMMNWGIRKGYLERSPFKIGTEAAITLDREIPRDRRFEEDDDEARLLAASDDYLRAVIIAMLDTACRPGERFDEAGVPISYVSKLLGHTNLSTTSRYLNIHRRGLQAEMQKLEEHRPAVAQTLHKSAANAPASVPGPEADAPASLTISAN